MKLNVVYLVKLKRLFSLSALFVLLFSISCKKDPVIEEMTETNVGFEFYPTQEAIWIIKSTFIASNGKTYQFWDTLYLGKDSVMATRTLDPKINLWDAADSLIDKKYIQVNSNASVVSEGDTTYNQYHVGWFRQDENERRIYTPRFNSDDGTMYEDLKFDFSLKLGDTTTFSFKTMIVSKVDSVAFGNRFLTQITYKYPTYPSYPPITQGLDLFTRNITNNTSGIGNPGYREFTMFIYKGDTLTRYY